MNASSGVSESPPPRGDVDMLRRLFVAAETLLTARAARIDRLNVFPVPDGDTGTNLVLSLRAGVQAGLASPTSAVGELAAVVARGTLLGARGNSGVILSQYLRGFAEGLEGCESLDGPALGHALAQASQAAYAAVPRPVEGTILTTARKIAEATAANDGTVPAVLDAATTAAQLAVSQTPEELPILREAGVVDAGALGLATILEGMLYGARGEPIVEEPDAGETAPAAVHLVEEIYGYCTQFLLRGDRLNSAEVRARLSDLGDSLLVVGDATLLRVHLHTFTPGEAIDRVLKVGNVESVRIDDMQSQNRALRTEESSDARAVGSGTTLAPARSEPDGVVARTALVAVAPGEGFARLFRSLGVGAVVEGGQGQNVSVRDLLAAIAASSAQATIVLPNNPNLHLAAEQAAKHAGRPVAVVSTRDPAQGVGAALAFQPHHPVEENHREMLEAMAAIRTAEVARAVRDARLGEIRVRDGDAIGMIYGEPVVATRDAADAVVFLLEKLLAGTSEVITLYYGADVSPESAAAVGERVRAAFPSQQVDLVDGGQPHYPYILACE